MGYVSNVLKDINSFAMIPKAFCIRSMSLTVPVSLYNSNSLLRDEIYELIALNKDYGYGKEHWVMYVEKGETEDKDLLTVKLAGVL